MPILDNRGALIQIHNLFGQVRPDLQQTANLFNQTPTNPVGSIQTPRPDLPYTGSTPAGAGAINPDRSSAQTPVVPNTTANVPPRFPGGSSTPYYNTPRPPGLNQASRGDMGGAMGPPPSLRAPDRTALPSTNPFGPPGGATQNSGLV